MEFDMVWAGMVAVGVLGWYGWRWRKRTVATVPRTETPPEGIDREVSPPPVTSPPPSPSPAVVVQATAPTRKPGAALGHALGSLIEVLATTGDVLATFLRLALIAAIFAGVVWLAGTPFIASHLGGGAVTGWLRAAHQALSRWAAGR